MKRLTCAAVQNHKVAHKGKASLEWVDANGHKRYYCMGYIDNMIDELLPECKNCRRHINYAQEDLGNYKGRK